MKDLRKLVGPVTATAVAVVVTALLATPPYVLAEAARIIVDGEFSDWNGIEPAAIDPTGDANPGATDFGRLWVANDERYLLMCIEMNREINIQSDNQIVLYMDTDDDPLTGAAVHGIGAELAWTFGSRSGVFRAASGTYSVWHPQVGIVTAPTVTSEKFEIAFDRSARPANSLPLFPGPSIRIVIEDMSGRDLVPDGSGGVLYSFDDSPLEPLPSLSMARRDADHVRVLTYNVLFDGFFEAAKRPSFNRMLAALKPDIIGFEEIYDHSAAETQARVESAIPSSDGTHWYSAKAGPDIIAVSRYPITEHFTVTGNGAFLLDLRPKYDSDLLLIVAHTPCCSNERDRQAEIDAFMAFIRDAKAPGGVLDILPNTPIVICGDMNLVGYRRQLETMLTGNIVNVSTYGQPFAPDWDGSNLEDAHPRMTDLPLTATWNDRGSSFWPGRLDYVVYSGSVMEMGNTFVAYTPAMPGDTLAAYGLQTQDAVIASDHTPVVADFALAVSSPHLTIHCLDVGNGDCTLIVSPSGRTFLLDGGPDGKGEQVVVPYLDDLGISTIDYICASNYEPEHIGGLDEIMTHVGIDSVKVAVLDRGYESSGESYEAYVAGAGAKRTAIADGQTIDLGDGVTVTCVSVNGNGILTPPFDDRYEEADLSIALVVSYMGFDFFVGGDLPGTDLDGYRDVESSLASEVGDIDVYRVNGQGSAVSSNEEFVSTLLPEVAIISVGSAGHQGYPAQEVIDRLVHYGAYVYQTETGTGGHIPDGDGKVVGGNIVLEVEARTYTVNGTDTYDIEEEAVPIESLSQIDANGEPLLLGQRVRIRGVATVPSGAFSTLDNDVFIEDATGGVNVFQQALIDPAIDIGDKVEVEGFVDTFAGLTRVTSPAIYVKARDLPVPKPVPLQTASVAAGMPACEGSLVELQAVHLAGGAWPIAGSDGTVTVDDGSGACEVFIDKDAGLPDAPDIPDTFNLVGVLAQYDETFPFLSGFRVMPRSAEDIVPAYEDNGSLPSGIVARILPNPARGHLRIVFKHRAAGYSKRITLYDVRGRAVDHAQAAKGTTFLDWIPRADGGRGLAGGIYFAVIEAGNAEETRKIVIMR